MCVISFLYFLSFISGFVTLKDVHMSSSYCLNMSYDVILVRQHSSVVASLQLKLDTVLLKCLKYPLYAALEMICSALSLIELEVVEQWLRFPYSAVSFTSVSSCGS